MVKADKTLNELSNTGKESYEPLELKIVLLQDDVVRTSSSYTTSGSYDDLDDWNFFDKGII